MSPFYEYDQFQRLPYQGRLLEMLVSPQEVAEHDLSTAESAVLAQLRHQGADTLPSLEREYPDLVASLKAKGLIEEEPID
ncbi:hypothetical protein KJ707_00880 [Patescibacteria group bacterium]|nr:hypothetical protein [Patescibacteria group bacterium]